MKTTNESWLDTGRRAMVSQEDLVHFLQDQKHGIIVLDGVSGCGKTRALLALQEHSDQCVNKYSYLDITERLVAMCKGHITKDDLFRWFFSHPVLAIEDIDYLRSKIDTQLYISSLANTASKRNLVIFTGNYINYLMPEFLNNLDNPQIFRHAELLHHEVGTKKGVQ